MKNLNLVAILAGLFSTLSPRHRDNLNRAPDQNHRHARSQGANGFGLKHDPFAARSSALKGHSSAAGWTNRKIRRYAKRGYGYQAPGNIERVDVKPGRHMVKGRLA